MRAVDEMPRPGFADELLARLERDGSAPLVPPALKGAVAGAVAASLVLLVAARRRTR